MNNIGEAISNTRYGAKLMPGIKEGSWLNREEGEEITPRERCKPAPWRDEYV
jgi:hypothetical protein